MKNILISGFIFLVLHGYVLAQPGQGSETEVLVKMLALKNSMIGKDSAGLANVLADDVSFGHTNGLIQSKAQLIRSVMSGEQDYKSIDPSDMKIRIYDNTGVVTMKSKVNMIYKGQSVELDMFITLVWIHKKNSWMLVARQAVKL